MMKHVRSLRSLYNVKYTTFALYIFAECANHSIRLIKTILNQLISLPYYL